jgi:hypothetical protein
MLSRLSPFTLSRPFHTDDNRLPFLFVTLAIVDESQLCLISYCNIVQDVCLWPISMIPVLLCFHVDAYITVCMYIQVCRSSPCH